MSENEPEVKETGVDEGVRSIGTFFLWMIPFALALAATAWLGFYVGVQDQIHKQGQENRAAQYVGAADRPQAKIAIEIVGKSCVKVTRADLDGGTLMLYAKNNCHHAVDYVEWHWQLLSPDKTAIAQGYTNQCPLPSAGNSAECIFSGRFSGIPTDDRAASIRVWTGDDVGATQ